MSLDVSKARRNAKRKFTAHQFNNSIWFLIAAAGFSSRKQLIQDSFRLCTGMPAFQSRATTSFTSVLATMATSVYAPAVVLTMLLLAGTAQGSVLRGGASQTAAELPTFPNIK